MFAIKGKRIIVGNGNVIDDGTIVIEGRKIKKIGYSGDIELPRDIELTDFSEYTILPGFVDSHTHLSLDSTRDESIIAQHDKGPELTIMRGLMSLQKDLKSGVTTMRCLGDPTGIDVILRDAIDNKEVPGPRLLACYHAIRPSHGTAFNTAVCADGVEEVRKKTREAIFSGADVIKLFVSNISRGKTNIDYKKGDLTKLPAYNKDEILAAVEEAHKYDIKVAAHGLGGPAVKWALEAGVDSIEHANLISESDIDLFLETNSYLCDPNLQLFFDRETGFQQTTKHLPEWWHEKVKMTKKLTQKVHRQAIEKGVKYVLATDPNHGNLWREAYHMVNELGASEMQAINSITKLGAELCGKENEIGTLEKDKLADFVVIEGNPLEKIERLKDVKRVYKEGEECNGLI